VDLQAGDVAGLTFAAAPARAITGKVTLPADLPDAAIGSIGVVAHPLTATGEVDTGVSTISGTVAADGTYRIAQLAPGRYAVEFTATDPWWDFDTGQQIDTGLVALWLGVTPARTSAATVDVSAASSSGRDIAMVRGDGRLSGSIDLAKLPGAPSWGYVTIVDRAGSVVAQSYADSAGFTQADLVPGRYRVLLTTQVSTGTGTATAVQYLRSSSGAGLHTVKAGAETKVAYVATPAMARVKGTVRAVGFTAPATTPLATARLFVRDGSEWVAFPDVLGTRMGNGVTTFTSPRLVAGTYTVRYAPTPDAVGASGEWWERKASSGSANTVSLTAGVVREGVHGTVRAAGYTTADPVVSASTPKITGTVRVGVKLGVAPGTWTKGSTFTYRWTVDGTTVSRASTFTPRAADRGKTLAVRITGSAAGYVSAGRTSTGATVGAGVLTAATPKITGTPTVGRTLSAVRGTWTSGVTFTYAWYASGKAISGARKSSLVLTTAQRGKTITVKVTGRKTGYTSVSKTSKATARVR
jgi:hypothetical protein